MFEGSRSIAALPQSASLPTVPHCETSDEALLIGTPSTTQSGWLLLKEALPRMVIREEEPTAPLALVTCVPATLPESELTILASLASARSSPPTSCTE